MALKSAVSTFYITFQISKFFLCDFSYATNSRIKVWDWGCTIDPTTASYHPISPKRLEFLQQLWGSSLSRANLKSCTSRGYAIFYQEFSFDKTHFDRLPQPSNRGFVAHKLKKQHKKFLPLVIKIKFMVPASDLEMYLQIPVKNNLLYTILGKVKQIA